MEWRKFQQLPSTITTFSLIGLRQMNGYSEEDLQKQQDEMKKINDTVTNYTLATAAVLGVALWVIPTVIHLVKKNLN